MILPRELVLEKELTKTKSRKAKGKEILLKKNIADQEARARRIPMVIPREKVESPQNQTKKMERVRKCGISRQDREEEYRQRWEEKHRNKWFERKKQW